MAIPLPTAPRLPLLPDTPGPREPLLHQLAALDGDDPRRAGLRDRIIEDRLPLASRLARRYTGRGEPYDDLAQVAALALVRAVDGFDASRGSPFSSYAVPTILGALRRHFRDSTWAIRVPRRVQELNSSVRAATGELTQRNGHHPSAVELADHLEVGVEEVLAAVTAAQAYRLVSLDAPRPGTDDLTVVDRIGAVDPGFARVDDRLALSLLVAALPQRERRILAMRFHGHLTQEQIADEVGLSQMHVSRLLTRSLARLRARMPS
ncbi:SigB/SigF/SigG family RNA polymerase sigma factor [Micromonospora sagamiensis]|uniref:RNA polymerase sigma-B factor n=1 Tax=Micromonospora sagamiensis TaxID=47875 RepID=A0A562WHA3_9ACTN|nr:SigB/SigF/SigG family RNA polymerase sigma factor [Micromonospora sagamiensis]TWJ29267.1 RNA polymerase sigma-B factor [Micromonospora sagamiensis]BCL17707.1 RNA polymerase sigma factor [Micromonospora sagamiensis]